MPELPEVETIASDLNKLIVDHRIESLACSFHGCLSSHDFKTFQQALLRKKIIKVSRRAKYVLMHLEEDFVLVVHLRMTGQLIVTRPGQKIDTRFNRLILHLSANLTLYFNDIRKFGRVHLIRAEKLESFLLKLGIEPLPLAGIKPAGFTPAVLTSLVQSTNRAIKIFLLDQSKIAGIGNIYADEILFASKIHPQTLTSKLSTKQRKALYESIKTILKKAVEKRGTSSRNYVDSLGKSGFYQNFLQVYRKTGLPCQRCGTKIKRIIVGQRSTHFCESCQKI